MDINKSSILFISITHCNLDGVHYCFGQGSGKGDDRPDLGLNDAWTSKGLWAVQFPDRGSLRLCPPVTNSYLGTLCLRPGRKQANYLPGPRSVNPEPVTASWRWSVHCYKRVRLLYFPTESRRYLQTNITRLSWPISRTELRLTGLKYMSCKL